MASTLAIIPARGGSKRVPKKNTRKVAGKPLIAHTIEQAKEANQIDHTIVSTDDDEIAVVAKKHGGEVPFIRPDELATDTATLSGTITHSIDWLRRNEQEYDQVCTLQVTSPLRTPADIDGALDRLAETDASSCVSVSKYVTPPQWAVTTDSDGFLDEFFDYNLLRSTEPDRSQDIPELHHPNGAIFAARTEKWREYESFYMPRTVGYEMPPERSFDIDEPWELELVRSILE